jgi:hypothetical protein
MAARGAHRHGFSFGRKGLLFLIPIDEIPNLCDVSDL